MKYTHITTIFLLAALTLLGGCSERNNNSAPTADTSSSSISSAGTSQPENSTENTSSAESSDEESMQSSTENIEPVPVEFTDEDRELQKILSELYQPTCEIVSWYRFIEVRDDLYPDANNWRLIIPEISFDESDFKWIPDNYRPGDMYSFAIPTTKSEMEEIIHKYFSNERTADLIGRIAVCESIEKSGKSITLKLKEDSYDKKHYCRFIEVDGRLYVADIISTKGYIDVETAKVTKWTDDTIEFNYLSGDLFKTDQKKYLDNAFLYFERAPRGTLKFEDGIWKMDKWDYMHYYEAENPD